MQHDQPGLTEWHPWMLTGSSIKRPPGGTGLLEDPAAALLSDCWAAAAPPSAPDDDLSQERFALDGGNASSVSGIMCAPSCWPLMELAPCLGGDGPLLVADGVQHGAGLRSMQQESIPAAGCIQLAGNSRAGSPATPQQGLMTATVLPGGGSPQRLAVHDGSATEQGSRSLAGCSSSASDRSEAACAAGSMGVAAARSRAGAPAASAGAVRSAGLQRAKRGRSGDAITPDDDGGEAGGGATRAPARRQGQKQQRISWSRHAAEMQQLEQQITRLTSANEALSAKLSATTAAKAELLGRLTDLTNSFRNSVITNAQLQRENVSAQQEIAQLKQQVAAGPCSAP